MLENCPWIAFAPELEVEWRQCFDEGLDVAYSSFVTYVESETAVIYDILSVEFQGVEGFPFVCKIEVELQFLVG